MCKFKEHVRRADKTQLQNTEERSNGSSGRILRTLSKERKKEKQ